MTTERFRYDSALEKVYDDDTYNGETTESYGVFECCEIMNEQHEIITDLTENLSVTSNREIRKDNLIVRLQKENEQLKSDAIYWSRNAEARLKEIDKLRKEKEQLKDTLAFRSNQLVLMEKLIDDLGTDEMCREMEDILNG